MHSDFKTNSLRSKLRALHAQITAVKKELNSIKAYQQREFMFKNLLPHEAKKVLLLLTNRRVSGKENHGKVANAGPQASKGIEKEGKQLSQQFDKENMKDKANILPEKKILSMANGKSWANPQQQEGSINLDSLKKRDELKDLKNTLWTQLAEIKKIEKREQTIRKANQKLKLYNSQNKRQYRESLSRNKYSSSSSLSKGQESFKEAADKQYQLNKTSIGDSEIQISLPVSLDQRNRNSIKGPVTNKALICPKGHQYYEGEVNERNLPQGMGRLEVCCNEIPLCGVCKDIEFYQGQFKEGAFHGFGTVSYKGGVKYVGEFFEGKRQGRGSLYHSGKAETAIWRNDNFVRII